MDGWTDRLRIATWMQRWGMEKERERERESVCVCVKVRLMHGWLDGRLDR